MQQVILSDNGGHMVPPVESLDVMADSGAKLTHGTAGTNQTATVVAGAKYAFTSQTVGGFIFGIATTATAANVRWCCPLYQTVIITIPIGVTALHYAPDTNDAIGYLRRLTVI